MSLLPLGDFGTIRRKFGRCKTQEEVEQLFENLKKNCYISDLQMARLRAIYERRLYTLKDMHLRLKGRDKDKDGKFKTLAESEELKDYSLRRCRDCGEPCEGYRCDNCRKAKERKRWAKRYEDPEYREKEKARARERMRKWRAENKEQHRAYRKAYYAKNREKLRAYQNEYHRRKKESE